MERIKPLKEMLIRMRDLSDLMIDLGYIAYSISQLKEPLSTMKGKLRTPKGIGPTTERIILEILRTGKSTYYNKLFRG